MADAPLEPVTLEVACAQLRVGVGADDATITRLITDAREFVEAETGLVLVARTVTETAQQLGAWIDLRSWPVQSIAAIRYPSGGQMVALAAGGWITSFKSRPVRLLPASPGWGVGAWPSCAPMLPVEIDVVAGYADALQIPTRATRAMLLLIAHWYDNRDAAEVGQRAAAIELPLGVRDLLRTLKLKAI